MKSKKRNIIEWALLLGIPLVLYLTGLHTAVLGKLQQAVLFTGIMNPETGIPEAKQQDADYSVAFVDWDGNVVDLKDHKGKTIFLNIWASWCPPCRAEMPSIDDLYKRNESKDILFIMLNMDQDVNKADEYLKEGNFNFKAHRLATNLPDVYQSSTIPTTFIISPEGKIVYKHKGMADYDSKSIREFIYSLKKKSQ